MEEALHCQAELKSSPFYPAMPRHAMPRVKNRKRAVPCLGPSLRILAQSVSALSVLSSNTLSEIIITGSVDRDFTMYRTKDKETASPSLHEMQCQECGQPRKRANTGFMVQVRVVIATDTATPALQRL
ncbi:hypothetical protein HRR83_004660 [Exophiala dermatitidis]|uniref:Uncharacterized protein n=1 Tax=Exophiala dermatitidis TaxID=5970 RepID=A0AAN6F264_EXODE|nr:hypothetical protein HRR74_004059 [Exophiala dermatitidis]KAJ4529134.1 hypothetical protein HRR73_000154 [Exophiala dermatitidis]KAJ4538534.1 hypothetical protein HRR77_007017 [Exophiala dermatitidis]KAJ4544221.1 hypothetical protein HRR76_002287 [Exophiala dermatitidis]KAJ4561639.1 hypothetical protein HRR79_006976 [Exophiala dermatitidis]